MSIYNELELITCCPRCDTMAKIEVEFRFGLMNLDRYRLGDKLRWTGEGVPRPRKRPPNGDFDGEGYAECPICNKDFWMTIHIRQDIIVSAEVDPTKAGYIQ